VVELADSIVRQPAVLAISAILLAVAFGILLTMIAAELRRSRTARVRSPAGRPPVKAHSTEEIERRQSLVKQLIDLYSGVHSVEALSSFLNHELERRHERWRVRIPADGPGEFYDLDP
jgi:hypothetical protein